MWVVGQEFILVGHLGKLMEYQLDSDSSSAIHGLTHHNCGVNIDSLCGHFNSVKNDSALTSAGTIKAT